MHLMPHYTQDRIVQILFELNAWVVSTLRL
jgi:hypothetical protein